MLDFIATPSFAREKDRSDPLRRFRDAFYFPLHDGKECIYFCGQSLGLQPKKAEAAILRELEDWRTLAIRGYREARNPWLYYQQWFQKPLAAIAGCLPEEVTAMNTLTVNLHLMLLSFYRPSSQRYKILMEAGAFPSDQFAVETQVRMHGLNPEDAILEVAPLPGEALIREENILACIDEHKDSLALVLMGGINYYTGQCFPMEKITRAAHQAGALAGFDLAHAIGNVPLHLHAWEVDFSVWCSYKYLNGGPGCVGGAFIHERHARDTGRLRAGGWWANEESTRFLMEKGFVPKPEANGWNLSTAQVFNMACLRASLELFEETTMEAIRKKSLELTGFLEFLIGEQKGFPATIITPADPEKRGAQLSLYFPSRGKEVLQRLMDAGIVVDFREPGVIRVAPAPLYNSFEEVFRFFEVLRGIEHPGIQA